MISNAELDLIARANRALGRLESTEKVSKESLDAFEELIGAYMATLASQEGPEPKEPESAPPAAPDLVKTCSKSCSKCGVVKPLEEFASSGKGGAKKHAQCKACMREHWREHSARMRARDNTNGPPAPREPIATKALRTAFQDNLGAVWYVDVATFDKGSLYAIWRRNSSGSVDVCLEITDNRGCETCELAEEALRKFAEKQPRWKPVEAAA